MPFEKVESSPDFPAMERQVLKFWAEDGTFEKRKALNAGKPKWSFLDGPITANNPMGVHHAWGRTYKDAYNRYFAMTGRELRYQNGFDCQGLWVEVEVEKELQLKSKRDIENLVPGNVEASIDKFVQACKDRVNTFARVQTDQSIRLGMWMDWDKTDEDWAKSPDDRKSYFTMAERNNFAIWSFLKKCFAKKLIYRGYDVMPWCGRCGVGISEQEMKEGYKLVEHRACFVKLPLLDKPGENLLVWTTTPWTLTSNVGAAINPKLTYLKVKLKNEIYYLAKGVFKQDRMASSGGEDEDSTAKKGKREWLDGVPNLSSIEQMFKSKAGKGESYEIVGEVKGEEMLGWRYAGPFDDLPAQQSEYGFPEEVAKIVKQNGWCPAVTGAAAHRVVSGGDDVSESEGTGIVHTAPGCGGIDFAWGKANGLPPVAPIGDDGCFHKGFGSLESKNAADPATADAVFEELKKKDRLFGIERYVHRYPHCWRCKTELLYRLVDEWFIGMGTWECGVRSAECGVEDKKEEYSFRREIAKVVEKVTFLPESLNGRARELDWLKNMGDWMISKKRYWGLALPIWVDEKDPTDFEVIGSREELKERAVEGWQEFDGHTPHRPWVDKIVLKNPRTGNRMFRVPDVGNPWLDAGIVAYSTLPADWRPADFITESFPGQFRNWFYALLALSTMMSDGEVPPFKTLLGFATCKDQFGHDMHKSAGNSIEFNKAADEGGEIKDPKGATIPFNAIGADVMRWLYCRQNPASNLLFGPKPADEVRAKFHLKLWNCYSFFVNYAIADGFDPTAEQVPVKERPDIDRWILSDLQSLIRMAHVAFEKFDVMAFALAAEEFVDSKLSNWYVRRNRDRFWSKNAELDVSGLRDKLAAYQTMHEVLTTLCRLIAPCVPFLAEVLWKNLRCTADPESVHLVDYPSVDESLIDQQLSDDTEALLNLVTQGGAARNAAKQKVRQPLAELRVFSDAEPVKRALARFAETLQDELNIKRVIASAEPILTAAVKLNMKTAGAKIGAKRKDVDAALKAITAEELAKQLRTGPVDLGGVVLDSADLSVEYVAPDGWAGVADRGTQVAIDARITPELRAEGLSRDVIRFVQENRKKARLELSDKIVLHVATTSNELSDVIDTHKDAIMAAVQAVELVAGQFEMASVFGMIKLEVGELTIGIRKADG